MLKKHVGNYVVNKEGYIFNVICDGTCLDYTVREPFSTKLHDATSGNALDSIYTTMKITNLAYFFSGRGHHQVFAGAGFWIRPMIQGLPPAPVQVISLV
jgi:hypothetical protein